MKYIKYEIVTSIRNLLLLIDILIFQFRYLNNY